MIDTVRQWLAAHAWAETALGVGLLLLMAGLVYVVARRWLLRLLEKIIRRTEVRWDDVLLERNVLRRAALFAPILVLYFGLDFIPHLSGEVAGLIQRFTLAMLVLTTLLAVSALLTAANEIYQGLPLAQNRPIKGYIQIVQIFLFILAGVLIVSVLIDRSPWGLLAGFGAMTAVLLLIFRDTILSLVASLQIASNDMVRLGDWIEMPQLGADGDVIDIALHTVKVQNWDKTITTIPTYKLIEGSFKNWRGMSEAGGRRIKRALALDQTSVRFLDADDLDRFGNFVLLGDYIRRKRRELEEYNQDLNQRFNQQAAGAPELVANARRLTNLGTFRAYVIAYLRQRSDLHQEGMTFLVRQLPPGPEGVPLEIYVFTKTTAWVEYEGIQADIFDHLLAIVPEFGLRVFQNPTGFDWARHSLPVRAGSLAAETR